jgi:anti-anti-sigma regulatory factor
MPHELTWVIERDSPYAVLRLFGVLTATSAPVARAGIATGLAAQPTAIIVEMAGLRIAEPSAVTVFAVAARDAANWPGAHLVLCCPDPEAEAMLRRSSATRHLTVCPTLDAAMAGMPDDRSPRQLSAHLVPAVGAARQARELVTEACARWDLPDLAGPACTVVTELVNNVVVHARTPMEVVIRRRERHLIISVRDDSSRPPEARGPAAPTAPGGRGLMMVNAVAQRWGYTPVAGGKAVWAVLPTA